MKARRNNKSKKPLRVGLFIIVLVLFLPKLVGCFGSFSSDGGNSQNRDVEGDNILSISFSNNRDITVNEGNTTSSDGYISIRVRDRKAFSAKEEIELVSENPSIATISLSKEPSSTYLYYKITGVSVGKTVVYARTLDGKIMSEKKTVTVTGTFQNITELSFTNTKDIEIKVGKKTSEGTLKITRMNSYDYSDDDVELISENHKIAVVTLIKTSKGKTITYEIEAKKSGVTYVYAATKDGSVKSEKIKVIVSRPIEVQKISFDVSEVNISLGDTATIQATVSPNNADDRNLTWKSDDPAVAKVDQKGKVTAVSGGSTTITASCSNGVSKSIKVSVDGSKRVMSVRVSHPRQDGNNIGSEWSYYTSINNKSIEGTYLISVGETLYFYAQFIEDDSWPDIGEASGSYTVTEDDILNGFSVAMDLYVTENGGRNAGLSAHFLVTFSFTPKK